MTTRSAGLNVVIGIALAGALVLAPRAYAISAIDVQVGSMESAAGQARNVSIHLPLSNTPAAFKASAQIKPTGDSAWSDASLVCNGFQTPYSTIAKPAIAGKHLPPAEWRCEQGKLVTAHINAPFSLSFSDRQRNGIPNYSAALSLKDASLSDAAGLHAGEKITATLTAKASKRQNQWAWEAHLDWLAGEAFWQPFYFASAGHTLAMDGTLDDRFFTIRDGQLSLKGAGKASFDGQWRIGGADAENGMQLLTVNAPDLNLAGLYPLLLKPLLEKTSLNNLEMEGTAGLQLAFRQGEPQSFRLDIRNADIADNNDRFALYKLNASIPWAYDGITSAQVNYAGGSLLKVPLGAADLAVQLNRYALTAGKLSLPILDGALNLADVSAAWVNDGWHWHLQASIVPIDMVQLSQALGLPRMEGKVAASIPMVTYSDGQLTVDGAMGFNLFNGSILVNQLSMQQPLGIAPKLNAELQMRNLDLGALTRTFAFGAIEGKLEGDVAGLQLVNWKPVSMDADFHSSDGRYPKKISQRAVENISALGGAGAAAAIQRSVLRFFKEFNYEKIGLSCRLRGDVCRMDGVESMPQGYVIVKGSGVPSITVMGYNHSVSWGDFLERIKRITAGNVKPVIE